MVFLVFLLILQDLLEICGSGTVQNIRSPDWKVKLLYIAFVDKLINILYLQVLAK